MITSRHLNQSGFVAGTESLAFGMLILVAGAILIVNAWSMVDSRITLDAAAREYLRSYTEASDPYTATTRGRSALLRVIDGRAALVEGLRMQEPDQASFGPCAPALLELSVDVPSIRMPFVGDFGAHQMEVRHVELINAHKQMSSGAGYRPENTACAG